MTKIYRLRDFKWKGTELFAVGRRLPIAEIVRDIRYPFMWRFRLLPGGELSDMVNLSRVKDAARYQALYASNCHSEPAGIAQ